MPCLVILPRLLYCKSTFRWQHLYFPASSFFRRLCTNNYKIQLIFRRVIKKIRDVLSTLAGCVRAVAMKIERRRMSRLFLWLLIAIASTSAAAAAGRLVEYNAAQRISKNDRITKYVIRWTTKDILTSGRRQLRAAADDSSTAGEQTVRVATKFKLLNKNRQERSSDFFLQLMAGASGRPQRPALEETLPLDSEAVRRSHDPYKDRRRGS